MALEYNGHRIGAMQYNGVTIGEAMIDGVVVYRSVMKITATAPREANLQLREELTRRGLNYMTIEKLPFRIDTSEATNLSWMFGDFLALKEVPAMDTSNVTDMSAMFWSCNALTAIPDLNTSKVTVANNMFQNCVSLTDGNVRLLGKHPNVDTTGMLTNAALTREPWYSADGLRALVTPVAPTFLAVPPWLVLPEVEGVTYTVLGHVAPGQPVEVHAHAEEGYELEGVTQWWRTITDYDPQQTYFGIAGEYNYQVPPWANHIDVVCIGGGGAGGSGNSSFANAGSGGNPGGWGLARIFVSDLPSRDLVVTVGSGGIRVAASGAKGGDGQSSVVHDAHSGQQLGNQGTGGAGGAGGSAQGTNGGTPGTRTFQNKTYSGGAGGRYANSQNGGPGSPPGGGGGAGGGGFFGNYWWGGNGAQGGVWITAYVEGD